MPVDTRRINGPESSSDYRLFVKKSSKESENSTKRGDGRVKDEEHRSLFLKTGVVTKAKGSAYVEQGQTKVICAVYGPREIPRRSDFSMRGLLSCNLEWSAFARPKRIAPGSKNEAGEREISSALGGALEATVCMHMYPKSQIDVYVTVLEDDGSALAAALTCSGLALADGGIHMFDMLVGTSVKQVGQRKLMDPTLDEEKLDDETTDPDKRLVGNLTVGYQPVLEQVALISQHGHMDVESLLDDVKILSKLASDLVANVQHCLVDSLKKAAESHPDEKCEKS